MTYSKIIVGYDFSSYADLALKEAVFLAHRYRAKIFIVHILERDPTDPIWEMLQLPIDLEMKIQNQILEKLHTFFPKEKLGVDYEVHVLEGRVSEVLTSFAEKNGGDLIVVGTQGHTGLTHVLLGDDTERVVEKATCPIWICRPPVKEILRQVLLPVDFSDECRKALSTADSLASDFEARLTLVHVVSIPSLALIYGVEDTISYENAREALINKAQKDVNELLLNLKSPIHEGLCLEGHAATELERAAREKKADIIVVTKKSHLSRFTTHLIRHAPYSVLVLPI